jgi:hypothetical protein
MHGSHDRPNGQFPKVVNHTLNHLPLLTVSPVPEEVRKLEWDDSIYAGWPLEETNSAWHHLAGREFGPWIHPTIKLTI